MHHSKYHNLITNVDYLNADIEIKKSDIVPSRLTSSRSVQWSAEGAKNCVYSRAQNNVNLSGFKSGKFDERTKRMSENYYSRKSKNVILTETRRRHTL